MKQLLTALIFILLTDLLFQHCANPITPTGGPKDTIPPQLTRSIPVDQQLNFNSKTIELNFDERINADKLQQNLIITPTAEHKYKSYVKKETLIMEFEESFEDSTTYTLNFADGITDITEKTPAQNLILAFSTGNFIDSINVSGKVHDIYTGEPLDKIVAGIYRITDTLDFKKTKPTYFIRSNDEGEFTIRNVRIADYRLLVFEDANSNLLFDATSETYGFTPDTLHIGPAFTDTLQLAMVQINASEMKLTSARPTGLYFEARYSKPFINYEYETSDSLYLPTQIVEDNKTLRIYQTPSIKDSLFTILTVWDSLGNSTTDTVFIKYRETNRKPEAYEIGTGIKGGSAVFPDTKYTLLFTKPTQILDSSFLVYAVDTLYTIPAALTNLQFNKSHTELSFNLDMTQDKWQKIIEKYREENKTDSTNIDSAKLIRLTQLMTYPTDKFEFRIQPGTLISAEYDTNRALRQGYVFGKKENFGTLKLNLKTTKSSYTVQLVGKDNILEQQNCTTCTFREVPPGDYWVRIMIDENQDGKWSYGNYLKNIPPEPVQYFPDKTTIRANWEVSLDYQF